MGTPDRPIINAQEVKKKLFRAEGGSVVMDLLQASLAFGISAENFRQMVSNSNSLIMTPGTDGQVAIRLVSEKTWKRDLWQEMIDSLERGRGEASLTKRTYVSLACQLQRNLPREWEDDLDLIHTALFVLWEQLPEGLQGQLKDISPEKLRSAVGIAGSEA